MKSVPFFLEGQKQRYPSLKGKHRTDVLVIGAGMAGLSAVDHLRRTQPKLNITLIESGCVGGGLTGYSAGILSDSIELDTIHLTDEGSRAVHEGIQGILHALKRTEICHTLQKTPSLYMARKKNQVSTVLGEHSTRKQLGQKVLLLNSKEEVNKHVVVDDALMAMFNPSCPTINPVAWCQAVAKHHQRQMQTFEQSHIISLNTTTRTAFTSQGEVSYNKLITTAPQFVPKNLHKKVVFMNTAIALSRPLSSKEKKSIWPRGSRILWDAAEFYTYIRPVGDRVLIGGADRLGPMPSPEKSFGLLTKEAKQMLPFLLRDIWTHLWQGRIPITPDHAPLVGEFLPDHVMAVYSAGLPHAHRAGHIAAKIILGEQISDQTYDWKRRFGVLDTCKQAIARNFLGGRIINRYFG